MTEFTVLPSTNNDDFISASNPWWLNPRYWISGADGDDEIHAGNSGDELFGGEGHDYINGYGGDDNIDGGNGNDTLHGNAGEDTIRGRGDHDFIDGGPGNDLIFGDDGDDDIYGGTGADKIYGGDGNDYIVAGFDNERDEIKAGSGHDQIIAVTSYDEVDGGSGNDTIILNQIEQPFAWGEYRFGGSIVGGSGTDTLGFDQDGGHGAHVDLSMRYGNINGSHNVSEANGFRYTVSSIENVVGTQLDDRLVGDYASNQLNGRGGDDVLRGEAGNDVLSGESGNDRLYGGSGNDILTGGWGRDFFSGGSGTDTVNFSNDLVSEGPKYVNLGSGIAYDSSSRDYEVLSSIENIGGTRHNDFIVGSNGANELRGEGGNDTIEGGRGNDTLIGGQGIDTFVFDYAHGHDRIVDFQNGVDKIDFSDIVGVDSIADLEITTAYTKGGIGLIATGSTIDYGSGSVTVDGLYNSQVSSDDFIF